MLQPLHRATVGMMHPLAARCVFWELGQDVAQKVCERGDPRFEKEAWLMAVLLEQQQCGFHILRDGQEHAIATIIFCQPRFSPGVAQLPTAPVSADAWLLSSLHIDPAFEGIGLEHVLIDAVLAHLWQHKALAVEAFGYSSTEDPLALRKEEIGLMPAQLLQAAGFEVVAPHPSLPRLRIELPPEHMLSAQAAEELLASALA
ncbi:hypothetical protein [Corynebacterium pseudopelargi]|uniref:N-acetyltransferase domain-containing protein n=1 Tax=Corynebacterium pseudopelargi TaxID=2080757 RepID=A0A3G6IX22_9CORY|nr:hypothetical protein [Corynebacterium pseudopelargi]AZA10331.1 hypothetical protein CPPEL_11200 [Corynebacterium pseudopelargi]